MIYATTTHTYGHNNTSSKTQSTMSGNAITISSETRNHSPAAKLCYLQLDHAGPLPHRRLADTLQLPDSTARSALTELQSDGLITRQQDPDRPRRYQYSIDTSTDRPQWAPSPNDTPAGRVCDRCDNTNISIAFYRMWRDNQGRLDGCRECLPRSVRFGEDVYDRDVDEAEAEFRDHEGF